MIRVLHFSDVHIQAPLWQTPMASLIGKRLLGLINLRVRRKKLFRHSPEKLAALARWAASSHIDLAVFTGDCTSLGLEPEYRAAQLALNEVRSASGSFFVIPGNHDVYLPENIVERSFERHFGELMSSDLPELSVDGIWPMIRLFGDSAAVIAVNSAKPNPEPWRASGRVPDVQLRALAGALADKRLRDRFIFVAAHHAPRKPNGSPDTSIHGFENGEDFLRACVTLHWGAVLHGHTHFQYCHRLKEVVPPIFCAGSATYEGREGFWMFEIEANSMRAFRGSWTGVQYQIGPEPLVTLSK